MEYKRSDSEWVSQLRGEAGATAQQQAHQDLSNYLYVVAFNALRNRQASQNPPILVEFTLEDLSFMAQDFVQDLLENLVQDDYALLDKYSGTGKFTSWIAMVLTNNIHHEFRRAHWRRAATFPTFTDEEGNEIEDFRLPVLQFQIDYEAIDEPAKQKLVQILKDCLEQLSEMERLVILARVVESVETKALAKQIQQPVKYIFNTKFKVKKKLKNCLAEQGIDSDAANVFG